MPVAPRAASSTTRTVATAPAATRQAVSRAEDFQTGSTFHRVLGDDADRGNSDFSLAADDQIRRVVICSGKVYYDLLAKRNEEGLKDVYILRLEQFYPFPAQSLSKELARFKDAEVIWCQEEPQNQGAWYQIQHHLAACLQPKQALHYAGRARSPAPAVGHFNDHVAEQHTVSWVRGQQDIHEG